MYVCVHESRPALTGVHIVLPCTWYMSKKYICVQLFILKEGECSEIRQLVRKRFGIRGEILE